MRTSRDIKQAQARTALEEAVQHSIDIIQSGIKSFVYDNREAAYRSVSTELRKLLLDKNAAKSFSKSLGESAKSVFELYYGNGSSIFVKSFATKKELKDKDDFIVTPAIYFERRDILYHATKQGQRVDVHVWLNEPLAFSPSGKIISVGTAINLISGKEGAHIIDPRGSEWMKVGLNLSDFASTSENIASLYYHNPWRQFIIDSGMRLLEAVDDKSDKLINHDVEIPTHAIVSKTARLGRKLDNNQSSSASSE